MIRKLLPLALAIGMFATAGSASAFYVDNSGSVGINNTSPQAPLDVSGSIYSRLVSVSGSSTPTLDWSQGNVQLLTLTSNTTPTFANPQAGGLYSLILRQDGTGGRTVTWPNNVFWPTGIAPTLTSAASSTDLASFIYDGTEYLGYYFLDMRSQPLPIVFDNAAHNSSVSATSTSVSLTVGSDSDRLLLVWAFVADGDSITSVTDNGNPMTLVTSEPMQYSPAQTLYLFYLVNPASGSNAIIANSSGSTFVHVGAASYAHVDQSNPIDTYGGSHNPSGSSNSVSVNLTTSIANDWIAMTARLDNNGTPSAGGALGTIRDSETMYGNYMGDSDGPLSIGSQTATISSSVAGGTVGVAVAISPVH